MAKDCVLTQSAEPVCRKLIRCTLRKVLFETIQESVDTVYYLEEDTIKLANLVLEAVVREQLVPTCQEALDSERVASHDSDECELGDEDEEGSGAMNQVKESLASHSIRNIEKTSFAHRNK